MKLTRLLAKSKYTLLQGNLDTEIADVIYDSRNIVPGCVFVCMVGARSDGHAYMAEAAEKGATAFVVEYMPEGLNLPTHICIVQVQNARLALAELSAAYFDYPAKKLTTIGLTGTKGKTTTTYMIKSILESAGFRCGLIGSICAWIGDVQIPAKNTTPESYEIHKMFAAMVEAGCEYVVMEVSSQGLKLDRTAGIDFDYGIFTNLSPDHIGPAEHASFEEYLACKQKLFRQCKVGIFNMDDAHAAEILEGHTCQVKTFSTRQTADLYAKDIAFLKEEGKLGMAFLVEGLLQAAAKVYIPGRFSVYNSLVAMCVCALCGADTQAILQGLLQVQVKGRVEMLKVPGDYHIIIDYAHNEVSTRSVLTTLLEYHPGRLICVFGCGGNRSKIRRYDIGEVAGELADLCVLTSDNPRFEEVADINNDIKVGLAKSNGKYIEIPDRKEALRYCMENAKPGDMIVTLGKGHEDYQEIKGVKYHFDEREAVAEIIEEMGG